MRTIQELKDRQIKLEQTIRDLRIEIVKYPKADQHIIENSIANFESAKSQIDWVLNE